MGNFQDIVKGETPTLVDFFATWCGPCKAMQPTLDQLKTDMHEKVRILKIDVDKNSELSSKLQIQGVPTLAIFKEGKMLWRQSGVIPAHQLVPLIKKYL